MFLVTLAESFINIFQLAGKVFLDMMSGIIPMLICLLLAINFLMKLVGQQRMERVATLFGRSRILTYGLLPIIGHQVAQVDAAFAKQAQVQFADGGDAQTVAGGAEVFFVRHDEADLAGVVRMTKDLRRAVAALSDLVDPAATQQLIAQDLA